MPLHQKTARTTARPARPHTSGATGKPTKPTHIYRETRCITIIICKSFRFDFCVVKAGPASFLRSLRWQKTKQACAEQLCLRDFSFFSEKGCVIHTRVSIFSKNGMGNKMHKSKKKKYQPAPAVHLCGALSFGRPVTEIMKISASRSCGASLWVSVVWKACHGNHEN